MAHPSLPLLSLLALLASAPSPGRAEEGPASPAPPAAAPAQATAAKPEDGGNRTTGMVFGEGHLFTLEAPRGWLIEGKGEGNNGLAAVFYPRGTSFPEAPAVLYVNTAARLRQEKVDDFIARDIEALRQSSPGVKVERRPTLRTADGKEAQVREVSGDRWSNRESLAFVTEDSLFVTLVLTARSEEAYRQSLGAFAELVKSYKFLTKDVKINR